MVEQKITILFIFIIFAAGCASKRTLIISHKGFHNPYIPEYFKSGDGLGRKDCKAEVRINRQAPIDFTEDSIHKAFSFGADYVEVDTRLTKEGIPILFHDKFLDCLTNMKGPVNQFSFMELKKKLAPNHQIRFLGEPKDKMPFSRKGVGQLISLEELFKKFPQGKFLLNPKEKSNAEIIAYQQIIKKFPGLNLKIWGPEKLYSELKKSNKNIEDFIQNHYQSDRCLNPYRELKLNQKLPLVCHNQSISLSSRSIKDLPGWPQIFIKRLSSVNSKVYFFLPNLDDFTKEELNRLVRLGLSGIIVSDIKTFKERLDR